MNQSISFHRILMLAVMLLLPLPSMAEDKTAPAITNGSGQSAAQGRNLVQDKSKSADSATVQEEHEVIGVGRAKASPHTTHPDAQWYPDAGLGLFIHWGISSAKSMNISWPMIPGRALGKKRIDDPAERERIIREGDWNLTGKKPEITPNEYWAMAKDFKPDNYDPDKWLKAAKETGFTYAVLTARHHEGFALWPSAFGDFNTKNHMGGRDLVKEYVEACRRNGIKVGLYYSPPDWYFDREHFNFLYHGARRLNPEFPSLDANLQPRKTEASKEDIARHQAACAAMVNGQIEELLTRYGKIDLLWFDGKPNAGRNPVISIKRIRELQPGIVINPRLHGRGDFTTYERSLTVGKPVTNWAEFCNPWTTCWVHMDIPFRAPGFVLGQLATCRSLGVNYLLGVGPMGSGGFCDGIYENMGVVGQWMKTNRAAIVGTKPLPAGEAASVPATAAGSTRFLFALPAFKEGGEYPGDLLPAQDLTLTLEGVGKPTRVTFTGSDKALPYRHSDTTLTIELPATLRTPLVDVVEVRFGSSGTNDESLKASSPAAVPPRPNFIVINIDDLGYADIGPFGSKLNRTPNLDRMAKGGRKLTSFYAAPVCSPSRSALMTGCYPKRALPIPSVLFPADAKGLSPDEITVAEVLKTRNYATAIVGKWHLGDQAEFLPGQQGFDLSFGLPYSNDMGPAADGASSDLGKPLPKTKAKELPPLPLLRNGKVVKRILPDDQQSLLELYTDEAVKFITDHKTTPFFLYFAPNAVHFPTYPGKKWAGKSPHGIYSDWVEEVDWSVGQVLDTLRKNGLTENTLVIFTSDNGGTRRGVNLPLRGYKNSTWEGGIRVCTLAWWPGKIPAGTESDAITGMFDILPTFAALAGAKVPTDRQIDGVNIWPQLAGDPLAKPAHDSFYYYRGLKLEAVREGEWKLVLPVKPATSPSLFNLKTDLAESTDVATRNPEIVSRMRKLVAAMRDDLGTDGLAPGSRPLGKAGHPQPLIPYDQKD